MNGIKARFSNREYKAKDCIKILDPFQAASYWCNGVEPVEIYPSRDYTTGKPLLVYVFKRDETKEVFDLWCKRELK